MCSTLYFLIQFMISFWKSMKPFFASKKEHPTRKDLQKQEYILLTYRSGIQKLLSSTYYTSDSGWGCMLRVGQMFVANLYYKQQKKPAQEIIRLFYDNKPVIFSFPIITDTACIIYPHKKQYQWFSPCQCGFIIKDLLDRFDTKYRTSICNDNCIFLSDIEQDREMLVVMVMCRIGMDEPQPEYLNCVLTFMKNPYFNCIMGGTPSRAHLFLKHEEGYLGYLDPHKTQKVPPYDKLKQKQGEFISKLEWIKQEYIDCSMSIVFVVPQKQVQIFWQTLVQTKQQLGESFFIYLDKQKPEFNSEQCGIIQIYDDEYFNQNEQQKKEEKKQEELGDMKGKQGKGLKKQSSQD